MVEEGSKLLNFLSIQLIIFRYIIVHMKRFMMNNFFMEKNPTIVSFPLHSLDLGAILGLNK